MEFDLSKRFDRTQKRPKRPPNVRFKCLSHPGRVRTNNEDSFLMLPDAGVWAVADGMGGHNYGEVASAIGLMALQRSLNAGDDMADAVQKAHQAIKTLALDDTEKSGMGTTLVAAQLEHDGYLIAWVGDSRAYLWRNTLTPLTRDHSYLQMLLDRGLIDQENAKNHPYKNVIMQALGSIDKESVQVDVSEGNWERGDIFLLCSDGLTGQLSESEIAAVLATDDTLDRKAELLLSKALAREADDNITLVLLAPS